MKMTRQNILYLLLLCNFIKCTSDNNQNNNKKPSVNIFINQQATGWYFVQIVNDSTVRSASKIDVYFKGDDRFEKITLDDPNRYLYSVFNSGSKELATSIKLSSFYQTEGSRKFFVFYNASGKEYQNEENWKPMSHYFDSLNREMIQSVKTYIQGGNLSQ